METLQISKANALSAYKKADKKVKELLEELFGKQVLSTEVTDRIKTFEDACIEIGIDATDANFSTGTTDEIAYKKLKVIAQALNEGTVLSFANSDQRKWYPWFEYSGSGFRFYDSYFDFSRTRACGGSQLCFHTEKLAAYAGKQFIDLYNDLLK